jgi:sulfite exporter TauE/SafE
MQNADWLQFGIGALLGLSAAPHCLAMCSGIATSLALVGATGGTAGRLESLTRSVVSNSGRVLSYVTAGGIVGAAGVAAFSWLDASLANITLRWLAAILLSIVGLSLAGIMPAVILGYPNRLVGKLIGSQTCGAASSARSYGALFAAGAIWGFMPCAMAYSALFYATISGSPLRGALTMAGFGLATMLPMMLPAFGVSVLSRYGATTRMKYVLGLLLAAIGFAGTLSAVHDFSIWCRT